MTTVLMIITTTTVIRSMMPAGSMRDESQAGG